MSFQPRSRRIANRPHDADAVPSHSFQEPARNSARHRPEPPATDQMASNPTIMLPQMTPAHDGFADADEWVTHAALPSVTPDVLEARREADPLRTGTRDLWSTSAPDRPLQGTWETESSTSDFLVLDTTQMPAQTGHSIATASTVGGQAPQWSMRNGVPFEDPLCPLSVRISAAIERHLAEHIDATAERTPERIEAVRRLALNYLSHDRAAAEAVSDTAEAERLLVAVVDEVLGYGPLDPLLRDESVSEIMVTGPRMTYVEQHGRLHEVPVHFEDDAHLSRIVAKLLRPLGLAVSATSPIAEGRLGDGTYITVVVPPSAATGPTLTIRRAVRRTFSLEQLVRIDMLSLHMADFLRLAVAARLNVVIAGAGGTGKSTLLNAMAATIDESERIVSIETLPELQLRQRHIVPLLARTAQAEGATARELLASALRMRPERILLGECRGSEAFGLMQAMTAGFDGTMTTIAATTPHDALQRIEAMCLAGGVPLPALAARRQLATGIDLITQCARLRDGTRRVVAVTEVDGMEGDAIVTRELFAFREQGLDMGTGRLRGDFAATGARPHFAARIEEVAASIFPPFYNARGA